MERIYFYGLIYVFWAVLVVVLNKKRFHLRSLFLWITYSLYSLTFEIIFGVVFGLYYYIEPARSVVYIMAASFLLYPPMVLLYTYFLPQGKKALWYTMGWILVTLATEIVSLYTKTIVLTGWKVVPWSILTYILSYFFVYLFDGYLKKVMRDIPLTLS